MNAGAKHSVATCERGEHDFPSCRYPQRPPAHAGVTAHPNPAGERMNSPVHEIQSQHARFVVSATLSPSCGARVRPCGRSVLYTRRPAGVVEGAGTLRYWQAVPVERRSRRRTDPKVGREAGAQMDVP